MRNLLARTARIAIARPRAALWTLLAMTAALFAVGVAGLVAENVDDWTRAPRGRASMVVYLGETVDDAHAKQLVAQLGRLPGVDHAELVPAAESARRLQISLGADTKLLDGVDIASLPASIEVTLYPGVRDVVAMSPTVNALRGAPGIDDVVVEEGNEDRVAATLSAVRAGRVDGRRAVPRRALALFVVLATVRVRLDRGRREVAVAQLLGAGPSYLAVPSALSRHALQGALAAGLALGGVLLCVNAYGSALTDTLHDALGSIAIAIPPAPRASALFVALGAGLGLIGGSLAGVARVAR